MVDSYGIDCNSSVLRRLSFFQGRMELRAVLDNDEADPTVDDVVTRTGGA